MLDDFSYVDVVDAKYLRDKLILRDVQIERERETKALKCSQKIFTIFNTISLMMKLVQHTLKSLIFLFSKKIP